MDLDGFKIKVEQRLAALERGVGLRAPLPVRDAAPAPAAYRGPTHEDLSRFLSDVHNRVGDVAGLREELKMIGARVSGHLAATAQQLSGIAARLEQLEQMKSANTEAAPDGDDKRRPEA